MGLEQRNKTLETLAAVLVGIFCFIVAVILVSRFLNGEFTDNPGSSSVSRGTWAEWDGESEPLAADILVQTTDTMGLTPTTGVVSGYFINNSNRTYTHLEAIYSVTDGTNIIGTCVFSTDSVKLEPGQQQGFTATCDAWGNTPHIQLINVGFH